MPLPKHLEQAAKRLEEAAFRTDIQHLTTSRSTRSCTTEEPTAETLMAWTDEAGCQATDGCWLAQDADACKHGYPSWAIVLGLAAPLGGE